MMGFFYLHTLAQRCGHRLCLVLVQIQFGGDLLVRQVQAHHVRAHDPDPQRLVMPFVHRPRQIVELLATAMAFVALAFALGAVHPSLADVLLSTVHTLHPLWPSQLPHRLEALLVVQQVFDTDHVRPLYIDGNYTLHDLLETHIEP
jgi:hypothetical protein